MRITERVYSTLSPAGPESKYVSSAGRVVPVATIQLSSLDHRM